MAKTKVDFEAHKNLTKKYWGKLYCSLMWREFLLKYFPMIVVSAVFIPPMLGRDFKSVKSTLIVIVFSLLVSALFIVLTSQYIFNSLVRIQYKDFRVCAVKDNEILDKMDFYDSLCWWVSLVWRHVVLIIVSYFILFGIEYFSLLPKAILSSITSGGNIAISVSSFIWVLKTKKTGRLLLLQPKKEEDQRVIKDVQAA